MPKQIEVSVLYDTTDVLVNVPSTYEEGDALVGEVGGVLDGFIADCTARNFLPRLYKTVAKQMQDAGHKKAVTGKTTPSKEGGTVNDIYETDIKFLGRIVEEDETLKPDVIAKLNSTASSIPFWEKGERTGGGKISTVSQELANKVFSAGPDKVEAAATAIESRVPGLVVGRDSNGAVTPEGLARAIHAMNKHVEAEAKREAAGLLG